jgi:hypothetical protein
MTNDDLQEIVSVTESVEAAEVVTEEISEAPAGIEEAVAVTAEEVEADTE